MGPAAPGPTFAIRQAAGSGPVSGTPAYRDLASTARRITSLCRPEPLRFSITPMFVRQLEPLLLSRRE